MDEKLINAIGQTAARMRCARRRLLMLAWTALATIPLGTAVALDTTPDINVLRGGGGEKFADVLPAAAEGNHGWLEVSPERASATPPDRGSPQTPGAKPDVAPATKVEPPASIPTRITPPRIKEELDGIQSRIDEVLDIVDLLPQGVLPRGLIKKLEKVEEKLPKALALPQVEIPVRIPPVRIPKLHLLPKIEVKLPKVQLPKVLPEIKPDKEDKVEVPEEEAPPVEETEDETVVSTDEAVELVNEVTEGIGASLSALRVSP